MSIALDNFVNVSITRRAFTSLDNLVYDTVVYCAPTTITTTGYVTNTGSSGANGTKAKPYSLTDLNVAAPKAGDKDLYEWAQRFFANGGKYIHVVKSLIATTLNLVDGTSIVTLDVPVNEIFLIDEANVSAAAGYSDAFTKFAQLKGQHQKIWVTKATTTDKLDGKPEGYVAVYNNSTAYLAAYYTKFRIAEANNVKDYSFTPVTVVKDLPITDAENNTLVTAMGNHYNVISYLAGSYRALNGDDINGNDLTNLFMRVVLQQTLATALINLLTTKIKLNSTGIASVKSVLTYELNRFVTNGYISTDKIWPEDDLYLDGELIVAKGFSIPGGYTIHVSPITQSNIENRQIPPIYILYGDQVGVRKIVLTGEVF